MDDDYDITIGGITYRVCTNWLLEIVRYDMNYLWAPGKVNETNTAAQQRLACAPYQIAEVFFDDAATGYRRYYLINSPDKRMQVVYHGIRNEYKLVSWFSVEADMTEVVVRVKKLLALLS